MVNLLKVAWPLGVARECLVPVMRLKMKAVDVFHSSMSRASAARCHAFITILSISSVRVVEVNQPMDL